MNTTKVSDVSLYSSGAYITRKGSIGLKKGKETILIEGLSASLDPSTLTVSLSREVKGSNIRVEHYTQEQATEMKKELLSCLQSLQNRILIREEQIEIFKRNSDFSNKENISIKEMSDYIGSLPLKIEAIREEIDALKKEEETLKKQLEEKDAETKNYLLKIDIDAPREMQCPLSIRYYEPKASWNPIYEIATDEEENATLRLKAEIRQNSREEWKDISLKLFSGNPALSADLPKLHPYHVDFRVPLMASLMSGSKNAAFRKSAPMAMEDTMAFEAEESLEEVSYDQALRAQNDTMNEYDLSGRYDIGNFNPLRLDLLTNTIPCRYHIIAIPKADSYGYLAGEVKTADIRDVINSSANIYHKDTYIGNIFLSVDPSKEFYDISLGKDENIVLSRTQKKKYRSNVLLKGQTKEEYVYELKVTSRKDKACTITLKDQIPLSLDKAIVVEAGELSGASLNEENGELSWDFELSPKESRTFTIAYSIAWPKDKKIDL